MARKKRANTGSRAKRTPARLVRFEEERRKSVRTLGSAEVRIGRDPTCDWIVDYANVSRRHAVIRPQGDRNVVQDLGSTNGVRINGAPLGGKPHVLEPGDVIELTEAVVLLYEEGPFSSSTPWIVTAIAMILLLIAAIGLYLSTRSDAVGAGTMPPSPRDSLEAEGPKPSMGGTHPGMHPPADSPPSTPSLFPTIDGGPDRASRDWTVAGRVRSFGGGRNSL